MIRRRNARVHHTTSLLRGRDDPMATPVGQPLDPRLGGNRQARCLRAVVALSKPYRRPQAVGLMRRPTTSMANYIGSNRQQLPTLLPRIQAAEIARPSQDLVVGRNEPVPDQRGRDNQAVGRIVVKVGKQNRSDADVAIDRNLDQPRGQ